MDKNKLPEPVIFKDGEVIETVDGGIGEDNDLIDPLDELEGEET